jgi:uncharacterized protein involved in outer membrane biogenesis
LEQIEYQPDDPPPKRALRLINVPWYGYVEAPRHLWRYVALVLVVLLSPPASLWLFLRNFDANAYKPMIAAVMRQATGRAVDIRGPIRLVGSFSPSLELGPVVLAPAPGQWITTAQIGRIEARLSLWGLLWGTPQIDRLIVDGPDIQIETGVDAAPLALPAPVALLTPAIVPPAIVSLQSMQIRDGRMTWRDAKSGTAIAVNFKRMLAAVNDDGGISLSSELVVGRERVLVSGEFGSADRLIAPDPANPWPVSIKAQARGASLTVQGGIARPLEVAGYDFQIDGFLLEARNFRAYLPENMPGLRKLALSLRLTDRGGGVPDLTALSLVVGASDLAPLLPGSRLDKLEIRAGGMDQALRIETMGVVSGSALKLGLVLGTPAGLLQAATARGLLPAIAPRAAVGFPIDVIAELGGSEISANGAIGDPSSLSGLDLNFSVILRDGSKLERLFQTRLPAWNEARIAGRAAELPGGLLSGVALRDIVLSVPAGDATGSASVRFGARPSIQAQLAGKSMDFDALGRSFAHVPLGQAPPLPPPAPAGMQQAPPMFSRSPLALGIFDYGDFALDLTFASARIAGLPVSDLTTRIAAIAGRLSVDRMTATTPGGGVVNASFAMETRAPAAPIHLTVRAPALALKPILLALPRAEDIVGTLALDIDVTAAGRDPHTIVSSVQGRASLALVDGELDTSIFNPYIFAALRLAKWPMTLMQAATGPSRTRCFAAALQADHGAVSLQTLLLDSDRLLIQAEGGLVPDLELIDIRIRPQLRLLGQGLTMPMRLAGSFAEANMLLDGRPAGTTAFDNAVSTAQRGGDACPDALTLARFGAAGPMPTSLPVKLNPMPTPKRE